MAEGMVQVEGGRRDYPNFFARAAFKVTMTAHSVKVVFDDFGWSALRDEAHNQGISVEELVVHAAMYYLSDLDSGRLAEQVLRRAEAPEESGGDEPPGSRFGRPPPRGSDSD
jgi:hypothetical protein